MGIQMSDEQQHAGGLYGPKVWVVSTLAGLIVGAILTMAFPAQYPDHTDAAQPEAPAAGQAKDLVGSDGPTDALVSDDGPAGRERGLEVVSAGDTLEPGAASVPTPQDQHADDAPSHEPANEHAPAEHAGGETAQGEHASSSHSAHGPSPIIPIWLVIPFALLLLSIALMPFINEEFWHHHFPDFAFFLGGTMLAYYLLGFDEPGFSHGMSYGQYQMFHVGMEYYAFIALIGGLFVASGGILIDVKGKGTPMVNVGLLAFGAVLANVVGTTGASVLLIRPFMRVNKGRLKPIHVVMFIFIVSNCGGALTPIGDPPLYLGFLKGVPFEWTLIHMWPMWAVAIGMLLAILLAFDLKIGPAPLAEGQERVHEPTRVVVRGTSGFIALALIIAGVFIDPVLKSTMGITGIPIGPTFQILVAAGAYAVADRKILASNEFNFFPVKEVGLLFIGIFSTMAPALGYLASHGDSLGLDSATSFYFATGALSGVLDNAPTYLNFLQVAFASQHLELNPDNVHAFLATDMGIHYLEAISLGAVFFGAMTYIGNGPNFMVRAIAEAGGLKMPSFFGYVARSVAILLPVLIVIWLIFLR